MGNKGGEGGAQSSEALPGNYLTAIIISPKAFLLTWSHPSAEVKGDFNSRVEVSGNLS